VSTVDHTIAMRVKINTEIGFLYIAPASMSCVEKVATTDLFIVNFGASGESAGVDVQCTLDTIDLACHTWYAGGQIRERCAGGK